MKQFVKNSREDFKGIYVKIEEQTVAFSNVKIEFAQRYAEKESHVRLQEKVNGIDKGLVYLATKSDIKVSELEAVTSSKSG